MAERVYVILDDDFNDDACSLVATREHARTILLLKNPILQYNLKYNIQGRAASLLVPQELVAHAEPIRRLSSDLLPAHFIPPLYRVTVSTTIFYLNPGIREKPHLPPPNPLFASGIMMKFFINIVRFLLNTNWDFGIKQTAIETADMPFEDDGYKFIVFSGSSLQWIIDKSELAQHGYLQLCRRRYVWIYVINATLH